MLFVYTGGEELGFSVVSGGGWVSGGVGFSVVVGGGWVSGGVGSSVVLGGG